MSLCFRTLPNKFSSFVNTRKQVTKIDRQLPKHLKSSPFLKEFLGTQSVSCTTVGFKERSLTSLPGCQSLPANLFDSTDEFLEVSSIKPCNRNSKHVAWSQQRPTQIQTPSIIDLNEAECLIMKKVMVKNDIQWLEPYLKCNNLNKGNINELLTCDTEIPINRIFYEASVMSDFKGHTFLYVDPMVDEIKVDREQGPKEVNSNRPSEAQLKHIYDVLCSNLPALFYKPTNFTIYTQDVILVNNIRNTVTKGILRYMIQVATLKALGHMKYAYVQFEILKITIHPEDDSIKVRWTISGITGMKAALSFWKVKVWKIQEALQIQESWLDGFSTFYVNGNGLVYKHVVDKMMPDQEALKQKDRTIAAKVIIFASLLGIDTFNWDESCLGSISDSQLSRLK